MTHQSAKAHLMSKSGFCVTMAIIHTEVSDPYQFTCLNVEGKFCLFLQLTISNAVS